VNASGHGDKGGPRDHLANDRTFLAWVRTAVAVIGLGFVVARFGLFLRRLADLGTGAASGSGGGGSAGDIIGASLIAAGVGIVVAGGMRFFRVRRQLDRGEFRSDAGLEMVLMGLGIAAGCALLVYLVLVH